VTEASTTASGQGQRCPTWIRQVADHRPFRAVRSPYRGSEVLQQREEARHNEKDERQLDD
jgi:hypothetical protein